MRCTYTVLCNKIKENLFKQNHFKNSYLPINQLSCDSIALFHISNCAHFYITTYDHECSRETLGMLRSVSSLRFNIWKRFSINNVIEMSQISPFISLQCYSRRRINWSVIWIFIKCRELCLKCVQQC